MKSAHHVQDKSTYQSVDLTFSVLCRQAVLPRAGEVHELRPRGGHVLGGAQCCQGEKMLCAKYV